MSLKNIIERGDIQRLQPPGKGEEHINLYQGNGRFGCCYGPWGLHDAPGGIDVYESISKTQLMHLGHWARAKFDKDYLLPLATIHWGKEPDQVSSYEQRQNFYDGTLHTSYRTETHAVRMVSWFDPVRRGLAGFQIEVEGECPPILIAPLQSLSVHYQQQLTQSFETKLHGNNTWECEIRCLNACSTFSVQSSGQLEQIPEGIKLTLSPGRNSIVIAVNDVIDLAAEASLQQTVDWWRKLWNEGAWVNLPDEEAQKAWVRSMAYVLYSQNEEGMGMGVPCGLTGNGWPFFFVNDLSYIFPALLSFGKIDILKSWVEYWRARLEGVKKHTKHLWNTEGCIIPVVWPYGDFEGYYESGPPNQCYYGLYHGRYLCRMAHETATMLDDPEWTQTHAVPLIREIARGYLKLCEKKEDGLWHIEFTPSWGQDSLGRRKGNQKDYLCALYSAKYCMQMAITYGLDEDGAMQQVLNEGLAFPVLMSGHGLYYTCRDAGAEAYGTQKHPVQLAPLAEIPVDTWVEDPVKRAYELRYDTIIRAKEPYFVGWSLGVLLMASCRMGDVEGWKEGWDLAKQALNADADWIQLYETSDKHSLAFFTTSHGLFAQAVFETLVSTWWGTLDIAACLPWKGTVEFGKIRTLLGVTVEGEITNGAGEIRCAAWKDTTFTCRNKLYEMKTGEKITITIAQEQS